MLWWSAQTTAIAAALALLATLAGRWRLGPEARHALWLVVLLKFACPPVVAWPWSLPDARAWRPAPAPIKPVETVDVPLPPILESPPIEVAEEAVAIEPAAASSIAPEPRRPIPEVARRPFAIGDYGRPVLALWLVGSVAVAASRVVRVVRFRRVMVGSTPAPAWLVDQAAGVGDRLGIGPPPIVVAAGVGTPMLWCLGRPTLVLPDRLVDRLAADRWAGILAHELAHLARRDHWVVRLELPLEIVWWWNPVFHHSRRRLRDEAEQACDARAVRLLPAEGRFAYAEALVDVCQSLSRPASTPALGVVGPRASRTLEGRLTMILRGPAPRRSGRLSALLATTLAAVALPAWTLGQPPEPATKPADPSRAEAPPKDDPPSTKAAVEPSVVDFYQEEDLIPMDSDWFDARFVRAFKADAEVIAHVAQIRRARSDLEAAIRESKAPGADAEQRARIRLVSLQREYTQFSIAKLRQLRARLDAEAQPDPDAWLKDVNDPEILALAREVRAYKTRVDKIAAQARSGQDPALKAAQERLRDIQAVFATKTREARVRRDEDEAEIGLLRARRDAKAAMLRKAEVQKSLATQRFQYTKVLVDKKGASPTELKLYEGEVQLAEAEVDRARAELAEAQILMDREARRRGLAPPPAVVAEDAPRPSPTPGNLPLESASGPLVEARNAVELLDSQRKAKENEFRRVEARLNGARARWHSIQGSGQADPGGAARADIETAEADLDRKKAEYSELEVRLKHAKQRAEAEEARLRRAIDRARADLDRAEKLAKSAAIPADQVRAARDLLEDLMLQLGPKPVAEESSGPDRR